MIQLVDYIFFHQWFYHKWASISSFEYYYQLIFILKFENILHECYVHKAFQTIVAQSMDQCLFFCFCNEVKENTLLNI